MMQMAFALTLLYVFLALLSPASLPDGVADFHVMEIIAAATTLACLPYFGSSRFFSSYDPLLVMAMLCSTAVSTMATGWVGGAVPTVLLTAPALFAFYFVVLTCTSIGRLRLLVLTLFAAGMYFIAQGFMAELAGRGDSPYLLLENTVFRYRGLGFLNDPNDLAQLLVTVLGLLGLSRVRGKPVRNFFLVVLPGAAVLWGIYKTHSRGGLIAVVAVALFGFKDKIGNIFSAILAGLLTVGLTAFNLTGGRGLNDDDGGRVALWSTGLTLFKTHPFFGVGMGLYGDYTDSHLTAHNSYILCLAELGLVGACIWLGLLVSNWIMLTRLMSGQPASDATPDATPDDSPRRGFRPELTPALTPSPAGMQAGFATPQPFSLRMTGDRAQPMLAAGAGPLDGEIGFDPAAPDSLDAKEMATLFASWAKPVRLGMVGFLVSAFFLSRTYTMTLYVLLGISVCLQNSYRAAHPDFRMDPGILARKTLLAVLSVVVFLYAFVRIHGA